MSAFFYSVYQGHRRTALSEELCAADPFALAPAVIVERVLGAGYTPVVEVPRREPFPQYGSRAHVHLDDRMFLVSVSRDAEMITVQEVRTAEYAAN